jgi:hypothetical protein
MVDPTQSLAGCISKLNAELLEAQKRYNKRCSWIASEERELYAKLLALAPEKLRPILEAKLYSLFSYKTTSFMLYRAGTERGSLALAQISQLTESWKEVVRVDVIVMVRGKAAMKILVEMKAVPHDTKAH